MHAATGPAILEHEDVVGLDIERGVIDPLCQIRQILEHDPAAFDLEERGVAAARFRIAPSGARLPSERNQPADGRETGSAKGRITLRSNPFQRARQALLQRFHPVR